MLEFIKNEQELFLKYSPELDEGSWVSENLSEKKYVKIAKVFGFEPHHLVSPESITFRLGVREEGYYRIPKDILNIKYDLYLSTDLKLNIQTFRGEKDISIFSKMDALVNESIVIGGDSERAIPIEDFQKLLKNFPSDTELKHYVNARISNVVKDYLDVKSDYQAKFENHLKKKKTIHPTVDFSVVYGYEIAKYEFIYAELTDALNHLDRYPTENDWQNKIKQFILLLFPKYVAVLTELRIKDFTTNPNKATDRRIDLAMIDANGYLDILEIKRPQTDKLLHSSKNRDNYTASKALSDTVMQCEKYIYYLSKWGCEGEKQINKANNHKLPYGVAIKITNPKALILFGRDNELSEDQLHDLQIIKRKYTNIADIITYDDLLRRLKNIIDSFKSKIVEQSTQ